MEPAPKKKHHKRNREDAGSTEGKDETSSKGSKKRKHHKHRKASYRSQITEPEHLDANDLLPNILRKPPKDKDVTGMSSLASSLAKRLKKEQSKNSLKSLNEKRGSEGKIVKMKKKKKSSFGLDPVINRIQLKKPARDLSIESPNTSPGSSVSDIQIKFDADKMVTATTVMKHRGSKSSASNVSEGGNDTPDEDNYDTEELRILNHEKMVYLINKKPNPIIKRWKKWIGSMDTFAARHPTVFHNMCIKISVIMLPILLISLVWDSVAGYILEVPHYSMINYPGFMLVFHFVSQPLAIYGYMMRSLMGRSKTCLSRLAVIAMLIHPLLLAYRCYLEWRFNNFRDEEKVHYEWIAHHHNFDQESHSHFIFNFS